MSSEVPFHLSHSVVPGFCDSVVSPVGAEGSELRLEGYGEGAQQGLISVSTA